MHHTSDSVFIKSDPLTTFVSLTVYCGPSEVRRCPQVLQAGLQKTYIINIQDIWLDNLGLNNKKWMTTSSAYKKDHTYGGKTNYYGLVASIPAITTV